MDLKFHMFFDMLAISSEETGSWFVSERIDLIFDFGLQHIGLMLVVLRLCSVVAAISII